MFGLVFSRGSRVKPKTLQENIGYADSCAVIAQRAVGKIFASASGGRQKRHNRASLPWVAGKVLRGIRPTFRGKTRGSSASQPGHHKSNPRPGARPWRCTRAQCFHPLPGARPAEHAKFACGKVNQTPLLPPAHQLARYACDKLFPALAPTARPAEAPAGGISGSARHRIVLWK
jgi:hypothetical protein